ncbi:MAG: cyclic nucleotide-binding domain-containing protein [Myxococcota bacterium]
MHPTHAGENKIEIQTVMPGAHVIRAGQTQLAVGFPEEVVKAWMKAGVQVTGWIIPDVRTAHGVVQWALEFPLYHALFIRGTFSRREKIPVVVRKDAWPDVVSYLRLTLLGLTREEMRAEDVDPAVAEMLARESDYLALKRADGTVAQVEDFLEPIFFNDEGVAQCGPLTIRAHGHNTWSFFTAQDRVEEFHLEAPEGQLPTYAANIPPATTPVLPQPFELIMLGASNGFDVGGACSNMVVQANGRFLLVDAGPYIRTTLRHAGVGLNQLSALIITHAHEDHAVGLSALLETRQRLKLFITRENAAIMRRKLAILNPHVSNPATLLDDTFDVVVVETGREYAHLGLNMKFHHTMHSIPCSGVELSVCGPDGRKRILITGDSDSRAHIDAAAQKGAITAERHAQLLSLYTWDGDLILADAGEGAIHGSTADFKDSRAQVVYFHTGKLKDEERHRHTLARAGFRYTLIADQARPSALERGIAQRALSQAFPNADADGINVMLDAATVTSVNTGQIVVRQGDESRDLYVAITGELSVVVEREGKGVEVGRVDAGEVFGERAGVSSTTRAATVMAVTPTRLVRIPGEEFTRFSTDARLPVSLPELWNKRRAIDGIPMLAGASSSIKNQLAQHAVTRTVEPGATLIRESSTSNTVFILVQGRVQVYKGQSPLLVNGAPVIVEPGTLIGETAPFLDQPRNASIVTLDECELLAIRGKDFKRIVEKSPQLFCHISRTVRQRSAA